MSTTGYAKLQNDFWRSPKGMKLKKRNPAAGFLYILAISYAADNLTDGHISEDVAYYALDATDEQIAFLVDNGYWDESDTGDGWMIHDYLEHQNSREQIETTRAKDRARKARKKADSDTTSITFRPDSARNPDGGRLEGLNTKHKTQNQNSSSSEEEEDAQERAASAAQVEEQRMGESEVIDLWEPSPACQGHADELERAGRPHIDLDQLATTFRNKLHARGLAAYRLRPVTESLDAEFRTWITKECDFIEERTARNGPTHTPPRMTSTPHEHTATCKHVLELMNPMRGDYPQNPNGFGPSAEFTDDCQTVADRLNAGDSTQQALESISRNTQSA
ncbi:hypothetical protein [Bifidobacterium animalis]|uniref:Uncharacterized protein n=1 Tax=Bifidobacterium animalis subsp. lactis TaxID=302911 RepID=A0A8B3RIX2_BIFAN|nr:hypothetical protein [Bifidobacterium animalis]RYM96107.1 hypothetical protein PG2011B_0304 [Bifidobacterium animalis subsp. lactis]